MEHPIPPAELAARVLGFFRRRRRELPWRRGRDAYAIWVSEIMLQQTRVETVIPYFERWMQRFPGVAELAAAEADEVMAAWSGLGYYSRARNLHGAAREVVQSYGGKLPDTAAALRRLPGIGRYTAGAIASQAFARREPVVDGNVARVLARLYAVELDVKSSAGTRLLWKLAGELVPEKSPGDFNQGLMELGQALCTPRSASCPECPLSPECRARAAGREGELPILPARRRAADKPLIEQHAAWIVRGGELLLARRRTDVLYGGLWELPAAASPEALLTALPGLEVAGEQPAAIREQVLSHRRLRISAWRARLEEAPRLTPEPYRELAWQPLASLAELGVSSATRALARRLEPGGCCV